MPPDAGVVAESRGFESDILRLEGQVPGLGGIYFDPEAKRLVAIATPGVDAQRLRGVIAAFLNGRIVAGVDGAGALGGEVIVRDGEYAFSKLVAWSELLLPEVRTLTGFVSIGADEGSNRVRVGFTDGTSSRELFESAIAKSEVPAEAVRLESTVALTPLVGRSLPHHTLQHRVRATGAGVQIQNQFSQPCTHGWTVRDGATWGFLTAAHCSRHETGN